MHHVPSIWHQHNRCLRGCDGSWQPRFQGLPIIAMTANVMAGDREKVIAAGMNDHIAKPINVAKLYEVLGSVEPLDQAA